MKKLERLEKKTAINPWEHKKQIQLKKQGGKKWVKNIWEQQLKPNCTSEKNKYLNSLSLLKYSKHFLN